MVSWGDNGGGGQVGGDCCGRGNTVRPVVARLGGSRSVSQCSLGQAAVAALAALTGSSKKVGQCSMGSYKSFFFFCFGTRTYSAHGLK